MKIVYTVLFLFVINTSFSQYYVDSLVSVSLDENYTRAKNYFNQSKYYEAQLSYDSLAVKWKTILDSQSSEALYQNYFFIQLRQFECRKRPRKLKPKDVDTFFKLESELEHKLSKSNIVLAVFYSIMANYQRTIVFDLNSSIAYSNKCVKVYALHEDKYLDHIGREYVGMGYAYRGAAQYDKAVESYLQSIEIRKRAEPTPVKSILFSKYALAGVYHLQLNLEEAIELSLEVLKEAYQYFDKDHLLILNTLDLLGIIYNEKGESQKALEYSFECLNNIGSRKGELYLGAEKHYQRISVIYKGLGKYNLAKAYLDSAYTYVINSGKNDRIATFYNSKALLDRNINDELKNLHNAIHYCNNDNWCSQINLPVVLTNLAAAYVKKGDNETALYYSLKAKDIKENNVEKSGLFLASSYSLVALNYDRLNMPEKAEDYYKKAITSTLKYRGGNNHYITSTYTAYGKFLLKSKRYSEAHNYLNKTAKIQDRNPNKKILTYINNNLYLSQYYEHKGEYEISLKHALSSYESGSNFYRESKMLVVEQLFTLYQKMGRTDACESLVDELLELSGYLEYDKSSPNHLNLANENYLLNYNGFFSYLKLESRLSKEQTLLDDKINYGLLLINKLRSEVFYESSEKELLTSIREFYNWSIKELGIRYVETNDKKYIELLYECIERSKSLLLDRQQIREEALSKTDIPPSVIDDEKDILYSFEEAYRNYLNLAEESDSIKEISNQSLFALQLKKEKFIDSLSQYYPDYYHRRYNQNITPLRKLNEIASKEDRTFVTYHWGDSILHKLTIHKNNVVYDDIPISDIEPHLDRILKLIKTPVSEISETNYLLEKLEFTKLSRELYRQLIGDSTMITEALTIVPDNKLVHLPFEILIHTDSQKLLDYRSLPYLITKSSINYCGSMSHYYSLTKHNGYKIGQDYVGFAPSYSTSETNLDIMDTRGSESPSQLLYNMSEVLKSSELFEGSHYLAKEATEGQFKTKASNSKILHLAMHTKIVSDQPYHSFLQFEIDSTEEEDGRLHLNEIVRLDLNSNLVVLSACETNVGENIVGESILGIARAFQLASCPNVMLTNWLIDDKSSSAIIPEFLKGINDDIAPSVSLKNAKLNYLKNSTELQAHPYFWSGYNYYGASQLETNNKSFLKNIALLCMVLIGLMIFYFKFRK